MDHDQTNDTRIAWSAFLVLSVIVGFAWTLFSIYDRMKEPDSIDAPIFRQTVDDIMEREHAKDRH
tara:strand:- start:295 stop:489 length:195 start_codon:yes stop_codon:yes gene_type:complete